MSPHVNKGPLINSFQHLYIHSHYHHKTLYQNKKQEHKPDVPAGTWPSITSRQHTTLIRKPIFQPTLHILIVWDPQHELIQLLVRTATVAVHYCNILQHLYFSSFILTCFILPFMCVIAANTKYFIILKSFVTPYIKFCSF